MAEKGQVMTQPEDHSLQLVVNLPELLTRVDNDRELLRELVAIFMVEFPRLLNTLRENIARRDLKQVESTSHALKGMLAGLSAKRAAATAARLERMGRNGDLSCLTDMASVLEREVEELLPELDSSIMEPNQ